MFLPRRSKGGTKVYSLPIRSKQSSSIVSPNRTLKFALIGDDNVGKTSLACRFLFNQFDRELNVINSRNEQSKSLHLSQTTKVIIQVVEVSESHYQSDLFDYYIAGCNAILFVYDITSKESFENLEVWFNRTTHTDRRSSSVYRALLAHKTDLAHQREVPAKRHNDFVRRHQLYSYQLSAKTGSNVLAVFSRIAADIIGMRLSNEILLRLGAELLTPKWKLSNSDNPDREEKSRNDFRNDDTYESQLSERQFSIISIKDDESIESIDDLSSECKDSIRDRNDDWLSSRTTTPALLSQSSSNRSPEDGIDERIAKWIDASEKRIGGIVSCCACLKALMR